jgi:hypothetical protein
MRRVLAILVVLGVCGIGLSGPATPRAPAPATPEAVPRLASGLAGMWQWPRSGRAAIGQAYDFALYTHCGINDAPVDFDGSFWDAVYTPASVVEVANPPPGMGNPGQSGTMTLLDTDHARFTFTGGAVDFTRHSGRKLIAVCY